MGAPTVVSKKTSGPAAPTEGKNNEQRQALVHNVQGEVDEVVKIMRANIEKVVERDGKLTKLEDDSENLLAAAERFKTNTRKLKRRMWWKNMKVKVVLGAVLLIVGTVVVAVILL